MEIMQFASSTAANVQQKMGRLAGNPTIWFPNRSDTRVGVINIVIVINCNLITFFKIIENNCNSVFTLITIIEM